jgi:hypothetical protein
VLYLVSAQIAWDYFPFGAGLGRFAGHISMKYYSDIYYQYSISHIWGLTGEEGDASFGMDTYWPYVLGELGVLGFILFLILLGSIIWQPLRSLAIETDAIRRWFIIASFLILTESLVEAFASPIYSNSLTSYFIFVPAGLIWARLQTPVRGENGDLECQGHTALTGAANG